MHPAALTAGCLIWKEKIMLIRIYALYQLILSAAAFVLYGADKHKAKAKKWRIRESVLIGFGLAGGGLGALLGMHVFRHKTKHWYFHVLNWIGTVLHLALLFWVAAQKFE